MKLPRNMNSIWPGLVKGEIDGVHDRAVDLRKVPPQLPVIGLEEPDAPDDEPDQRYATPAEEHRIHVALDVKQMANEASPPLAGRFSARRRHRGGRPETLRHPFLEYESAGRALAAPGQVLGGGCVSALGAGGVHAPMLGETRQAGCDSNLSRAGPYIAPATRANRNYCLRRPLTPGSDSR